MEVKGFLYIICLGYILHVLVGILYGLCLRLYLLFWMLQSSKMICLWCLSSLVINGSLPVPNRDLASHFQSHMYLKVGSYGLNTSPTKTKVLSLA